MDVELLECERATRRSLVHVARAKRRSALEREVYDRRTARITPAVNSRDGIATTHQLKWSSLAEHPAVNLRSLDHVQYVRERTKAPLARRWARAVRTDDRRDDVLRRAARHACGAALQLHGAGPGVRNARRQHQIRRSGWLARLG